MEHTWTQRFCGITAENLLPERSRKEAVVVVQKKVQEETPTMWKTGRIPRYVAPTRASGPVELESDIQMIQERLNLFQDTPVPYACSDRRGSEERSTIDPQCCRTHVLVEPVQKTAADRGRPHLYVLTPDYGPTYLKKFSSSVYITLVKCQYES